MNVRDSRLAECLRLLEETGDLERCLELYPDLGRQLREYDEAARGLSQLAPPSPLPESQNSARRLLLSSLGPVPGGTPAWKRLFSNKAAAIAAAATLFVLGTVGAGAATGSPFTEPVNDVLSNLGIGGDHREEVSEKVRESNEDIDPGPERGKVACEIALNRDSLPSGAREAAGQADREERECGNPEEQNANQDQDPEPSEQNAGEAPGQTVAEDVHEAIDSTDPGPERGEQVSEAACKAAQDQSKKPSGAQNAPGLEHKPEKECTHPNSAPDE